MSSPTPTNWRPPCPASPSPTCIGWSARDDRIRAVHQPDAVVDHPRRRARHRTGRVGPTRTAAPDRQRRGPFGHRGLDDGQARRAEHSDHVSAEYDQGAGRRAARRTPGASCPASPGEELAVNTVLIVVTLVEVATVV